MNGEYIYNETLVGTIDGVNKTFTTLNNIERIEEVYYLGVAYRDVSFVDNIVTFTDAPLLGSSAPTIDYFKLSVSPTPSSDVTFGEVIDDVYEKIYSQTRADGVDVVTYKLSQIKTNINNGLNRIKNLRTYKGVIASYSFNKAKDLSAIAYNASYVNVGASVANIPANGMYILKNSVPINYTSYTTGFLNGTVGVVYENGDLVSVGYKIPSGVKKVSEVIVDGVPLTYLDVREFSLTCRGFSIVRNSAGDQFIFLPYSTRTNQIVTVTYIPSSTTLVADADIVDIEREYFELLSYYTLYNMYQDREDDRWQMMYKKYIDLLREYKSYKSRAVDGINNEFKSDVLVNF